MSAQEEWFIIIRRKLIMDMATVGLTELERHCNMYLIDQEVLYLVPHLD